MVTIGYYFAIEVEAIAARDACNTYYGLPIGDMANWCSIELWGEGWAIIYDDSLNVVLGEPVVLPVIDNE